MARAIGAARALTAAWLLACTSFPRAVAQVYAPQILDFSSFVGDTYREVTADVIFGVVKLSANIQVEKLETMQEYLSATLASICPTPVRVICKAYQEVESFNNVFIDFHVEYRLLPFNRDSSQCKQGLVNSVTTKQILSWRVKSDSGAPLGWDPTGWTVAMRSPTVERINVRFPDRLTVPALSSTAPGPLDPFEGQQFIFPGSNGNRNGTGVNDPNCNYATSACICATTASCAWQAAESRCVGLSGPPTQISCDDCGLQASCTRNQVEACDLNREPCTCALSHHDCRWDLSTMSCKPRNGFSTPCTVCSRQDHCDSPQITTVTPAQGSRFGASSNRVVVVTFDRYVSLQSVMDGVTYLCEGSQRPNFVAPSLLSISGKALTIEVAAIPQEKEASCHLALGEGVVRDMGNLNFRGTTASWFPFRLQDTLPPTVAEFTPANGAADVTPGTSAELVFNEPVMLTLSCEVSLYSRGILVTTFPMNSPLVTLETEERKSLTVAIGPHLENSQTYSLKLPSGCTRDDAGNNFRGLGEGVYMFHTQTNTFSRPLPEDDWKIILGAILGGVAVLVVLISCTVLCVRMRSARQNFAVRLAEQASKARRWSASSLDGIWTEFANYRARRFSFDTFAMTGWGGGKRKTSVGSTEDTTGSDNLRKVHPEEIAVVSVSFGLEAQKREREKSGLSPRPAGEALSLPQPGEVLDLRSPPEPDAVVNYVSTVRSEVVAVEVSRPGKADMASRHSSGRSRSPVKARSSSPTPAPGALRPLPNAPHNRSSSPKLSTSRSPRPRIPMHSQGPRHAADARSASPLPDASASPRPPGYTPPILWDHTISLR